MGRVPVNNDGAGNKGLAELNHNLQDEHKEVRDRVLGEGQGLSGEGESRINKVTEDVKDGRKGAIQAQAVLPRPQQQPQGPVVRWERFLPLRSLKVLLVEKDDSTRHVVSALLRNCSYEVSAAANIIQAWKILEDLTNHIDLILTEVFMPCLSGIGLLCKVMSHKTCKNIPVIMMSSHDSMGVVFKCLSKGAVDFLVKPIRKNELKNLWQHVWRRCHSSSGSVSESGIRTQKYMKSISVEESGNNIGSNDDDDDGSSGLNVRDGSENGSGTQSSWTKRAVEIDSPQPMSSWDQLADPPDSTCAQVIHSKPETVGNNWVPRTATREHQEQDEQIDKIAMGKDLEIGVPRNPDLLVYQSEKVLANQTGTKQDKLAELNSKKDNEQLDNGWLDLNGENPSGNLSDQAVDLIGVITKSSGPRTESGVFEAPNSISKTSEIKDKVIYDTIEPPSLELSLKRLREDARTAAHDDRNVLRRSDLSAFSRYNTASTANQAPTGNVGSCSPVDNSSEVVKTESLHNFPSHSNGTPPNQQSNGSSNKNDMGSMTDNVSTKPAAFTNKSASTSTVKCLQSSAFQSVQNGHVCPPQQVDDVAVNTVLTQPRGRQQQVQVQHHHHHYHHYHHHVHNMQQQQQKQQKQQQPPHHDDLSLNNMEDAAQQCGLSNGLNVLIEGNTGNYSLNGSASGSNHGSNEQNISRTAMNVLGMNMESDNGVAGKSGADGGSGSGSGSGVDHNQFTQREATLTKYRQKRNERYYGKKVRYHNRQRLAEQRPRVRGQFVRQNVYENTSGDADS